MARRSAIGSLSILRLTKRQCACSLTVRAQIAVKYATAEQELFDLFRDQLPSVRRDVVVVDTALPLGRRGRTGPSRHGRRQLGAGILGIRFGRARVGERSGTTTSSTSRLRRFVILGLPGALSTGNALAVAGRPACLGHIDCYNEPIQVAGCTSQHWVLRPASSCPLSNSRFSGAWSPYGIRRPGSAATPRIRFVSDAPLSPEVSPIDHRLAHRSGHRARGEWHSVDALGPRHSPSSSGRRRPS